MVMMQSPNAQSSAIPQPASSPSISGATAPNSPPKPSAQNINNNNNNTIQTIESPLKSHSFDQPRLERPLATKFDTMLLTRFHQDHQHAAVLALASAAAAASAAANISEDVKAEKKTSPRPVQLYKDLTESTTGDAKFAIERLKQLTDHSINRLSPTDDSSSNQSQQQFRRPSPGGRITASPTTTTITRTSPPVTSPTSIPINEPDNCHRPTLPHHPAAVFPSLSQNPFPTLKYHPASGPPPQIVGLHPHHLQHLQHQQHLQQQHLADMERMKLARSIGNANAGTKDLSDFGFRIQLGGLQQMNGGSGHIVGGGASVRRKSCSARSDSSEELVVDGNDDEDEEAEANEADGGSATVC